MGRWIAGFVVLFLAACGGGTDTSEPASDPVETSQPEPAAERTETPVEPIDATGAVCGGISGVLCPSGYYCEQPEGQCLEVMDGTGTCQPVPQVCTREYRPVCGCDGTTYPNACGAAAAGVSIAAEGECAGEDTL